MFFSVPFGDVGAEGDSVFLLSLAVGTGKGEAVYVIHFDMFSQVMLYSALLVARSAGPQTPLSILQTHQILLN